VVAVVSMVGVSSEARRAADRFGSVDPQISNGERSNGGAAADGVAVVCDA